MEEEEQSRQLGAAEQQQSQRSQDGLKEEQLELEAIADSDASLRT